MHPTALGGSMSSSRVHTHTHAEFWLFGQCNMSRSIELTHSCARAGAYISFKIKSRVIDHHK